jgi:hypothetical protein
MHKHKVFGFFRANSLCLIILAFQQQYELAILSISFSLSLSLSLFIPSAPLGSYFCKINGSGLQVAIPITTVKNDAAASPEIPGTVI